MAPEHAILSPPLSGRTSKTQEPRVPPAGVLAAHGALSAACGAGADSRTAMGHLAGLRDPFVSGSIVPQPVRHQHIAMSPGKKRGSSMSRAEDRMLTPPLSRDTRMDGGKADSPASRSMSDGEVEAQMGDREAFVDDLRHPHATTRQPQEWSTKRHGGPVASADSDGEDNPFWDQHPASASSNLFGRRPAQTTTSYAEPEDVEEEDDGWQSGEGSEAGFRDTDGSHERPDLRNDATPRPYRTGRLARPTRDNIQVDSQDVSGLEPIRDTPMNPFLEGGPADSGLEGPRAAQARMRARMFPGKEKGKITYVFRGQRVVYADPEYDSDDSDEALYQRTGQQRPPRLQPKLLFPSASTSSAGPSSRASKSATTAASQPGPSRPRGGLFAAEIAARESAKRKAREQPTEWTSGEAGGRLQAMMGSRINDEREAQAVAHAESRSRPSWRPGQPGKDQRNGAAAADTSRSALLAKLEEAEWSEEGDDDGEASRSGEGEGERASKRARLDNGGGYGEGGNAHHGFDGAATASGAHLRRSTSSGLMAAFGGGDSNDEGGAAAAQQQSGYGRGLAQRMKRRNNP